MDRDWLWRGQISADLGKASQMSWHLNRKVKEEKELPSPIKSIPGSRCKCHAVAWRIAQPCAWSLVNYRHVHEKRSQSRAVGPDPTGAWGWWEEFLCHSNCKGKH